MSHYHRLLKRQLKKANFSHTDLEKMADFLEQVNSAYVEHNNDLAHLENILERSSQELFHANKKLRSNMDRLSTRLEGVVNQIEEVIFEVDLHGNWNYLNPAWEKLTGFKVSECLGQPITQFLIHVDGNDRCVLEEFIASKKHNALSISQIVQIVAKSGEKRWLDFSLRHVPHSEGKGYTGYIGTLVDITKLKETELALLETRNKEIKANQAKDEFLSTMSHEIRTPLNIVIGTTHVLLMEDPKAEQLENLNALKYASEHLLGLVNNVLDFNKIESGNLKLEHSVFSIQHILEGLHSIFSPKAANKGIKFKIKKDAELPEYLVGDSVRLAQVLNNLVNNGIKFTEKGQVILDIEVETIHKDTIDLRFEVKDTGIGIPSDKQDVIFDVFTQASLDTTRKHGGTGLGLAICKKLLNIMNSEIQVDSTVGLGTSFYFSLTLGLSGRTALTGRNTFSEEELEGLTVLIVEDFEMNIRMLARFFDKWGISYDIAENGRIACEKAEAKNYDLILMDLQMPEMDGYEAASLIRESEKGYNKWVPIAAFTASAGLDVKEKIRQFGMNMHISKPFNPMDLYQVLKEAKHFRPQIHE